MQCVKRRSQFVTKSFQMVYWILNRCECVDLYKDAVPTLFFLSIPLNISFHKKYYNYFIFIKKTNKFLAFYTLRVNKNFYRIFISEQANCLKLFNIATETDTTVLTLDTRNHLIAVSC